MKHSLSFRFRSVCLVFVALFAVSVPPLHAQWTFSWGDDFNGTANTTYNHNNWTRSDSELREHFEECGVMEPS